MMAASPPGPDAGLPLPFVTICVPALNEAGYIEACLLSLLGQWPGEDCEILVLDGGSTDATASIVATLRAQHPTIRLLANSAQTQSAALNLAARAASPRANILVRADAHALYPIGFVASCVRALRENAATSVVVPMRTRARGGALLQHAIAAAQSSRLGNGGAAHRAGCASGFVEHGHHAAFDLGFFRALGGYDESFTHNEDAELDLRAVAAGGRIWMCAEAPVVYYPRARLGALARQYFRHGAGRARTLRKHRIAPRLRQLVPVVALAGCAAGLALAPVAPSLAALALLYPAACLGWSIAAAVAGRDARLLACAPALITMHLAWATGLLVESSRRRGRR